MKEIQPFKKSAQSSLGVEIELQLISPHNYHLMARAKEFIRRIRTSAYCEQIKPEVTQSMLEINSAVHATPSSLLEELTQIRDYMVQEALPLQVYFSGGGTHPFQLWKYNKIFPAARYRRLSRHYGYLAKRFTIFGQHIHIGCATGDDAIFLVRALARYVPQFIALSASSPFYQGVDTTFDSARIGIVNAFPTSGHMPFTIQSWAEFSDYYQKTIDLKIIDNMRDVYWDIRPKPELGTIEIRVYDTPLTINKTVLLAAYTHILVNYLLANKNAVKINTKNYALMLYNYNRYQASRYGFEGDFIDPISLEHRLIADDISLTIKSIMDFSKNLRSDSFLQEVFQSAALRNNDAKWLRDLYLQERLLRKVVAAQSQLWMEG